jgi:hypothetical protein
MESVDSLVVGAGVVGLAVARPGARSWFASLSRQGELFRRDETIFLFTHDLSDSGA